MMQQELKSLFARAEGAAKASGDTSTKVGAVLVTCSGVIAYEACNDLPRGVVDMPARRERPLKYKYVVHAESNLICRAARDGVEVAGGTIVTTHHPCSDCAKLIIQAGISTVHYDKGTFGQDWSDDLVVAATMLSEAGVTVIEREKKGA